MVDHSAPRLLRTMSLASLVGFAIVMYMTLVYAGTDSIQGHVQRIFYPHFASFAGAVVGFICGGIGGALYIWTRRVRWDNLSIAGIEVGIVLMSVTLLTGMIWSRPTWNTWWTDDPRLTSSLMVILLYLAYLVLRNGFDSPHQRRIFAGMFSMAGLIFVLYTFIIIRFRSDTIHPVVIGSSPVNADSEIRMAASMRTSLLVSVFVFVTIITPTLVWWRYRLQGVFEAIDKDKRNLSGAAQEGI